MVSFIFLFIHLFSFYPPFIIISSTLFLRPISYDLPSPFLLSCIHFQSSLSFNHLSFYSPVYILILLSSNSFNHLPYYSLVFILILLSSISFNHLPYYSLVFILILLSSISFILSCIHFLLSSYRHIPSPYHLPFYPPVFIFILLS